MNTRLPLPVLLFVALARPAQAQNLAGVWQGVELNPGSAASEYWPTVLTLRAGAGAALTGELYQVAGSQPGVTGTFAMRGTRTATGLRLAHGRVLAETNPDGGDWCLGTIVFTYNAALEKLVGRSTYTTEGCHDGTSELYRVVLKSAGAVPRGAATVLRVSGRNVRWFADAALRRPLAAGNSYRTRLAKTTTFYLTQGFYPTDRSPVTPVVVRTIVAPPPVALPPPPPDTAAAAKAAEATAAPRLAVAPLVLPTVLFRLGTAALLPTAAPALDSLAAQLRRRPALRLRIGGHTDRIGEAGKNLALSQQRAETTAAYLRRAGIAPERLETVGYGDTRPRYQVPDPRNRRVEVEELR